MFISLINKESLPSLLPRKCYKNQLHPNMASRSHLTAPMRKTTRRACHTPNRNSTPFIQEQMIRTQLAPVLHRQVTLAEVQTVQQNFQKFVLHYKRDYLHDTPRSTEGLSNWLKGLLDSLRNYKQRSRLPIADISMSIVVQQYLGSEYADWSDEEIHHNIKRESLCDRLHSVPS